MVPKLSNVFALVACILTLIGCCDDKMPASSTPVSVSTSPPKQQPIVVEVAYGSEKKTWLEEQVEAFHASNPQTKSGRPVKIKTAAMGSGEVVSEIVAGTRKPHVFSPASGIYITLLNSQWELKAGRAKALAPSGDPLVLSPIVVAMWKPMAEVLGWPGKQLGWADLLRVHKDPKGWASFNHAEWGMFKLGHTHPEYSNSGLLSVLAEAYAGAKKTRGLSASDLDSAGTKDYVTAIEQSIVHYGKSTGFFSDKMLERGASYLSAAVLYENLVIESYSKQGTFPLVSVYPVEGTFWSDHPYSILDADWVKAEEREGAQLFLAHLKAKPAQQRALALGFRPGDPSIPIGSPIDAAHGADPKQPQTLLEIPSGQVLEKLLSVWAATKKPSSIIFVFDKSGSMSGKPLTEAKIGAKAFFDILHERDEVTLLMFDDTLYPTVGPLSIGKGKQELAQRIDGQIAQGGTALYDAVASAYATAQERAKKAPGQIHAVVVMTDGNDEHSKMKLEELTAKFSGENAEVKVFTIAYGANADPRIMERIAEAAKGSTSKGNPETIVQVYKDMGSFF